MFLLTAKTVQGTTLTFQSVHDVHGRHSLPLGVFGVSYGVPNNVFQEYFQHATGLLVYQTGDTLYTAATSETPDSGLSDALDVVSQHLSVSLGSSLPQSFATFSASGHVALAYVVRMSRYFPRIPSFMPSALVNSAGHIGRWFRPIEFFRTPLNA